MRNRTILLGASIALCWTAVLAACASLGSLNQVQTATAIANCQAAARLADAGNSLHTYDVCMREAGLHD